MYEGGLFLRKNRGTKFSMGKKSNQQHKLKGEEKRIVSNAILYLSSQHQLGESTETWCTTTYCKKENERTSTKKSSHLFSCYQREICLNHST